MRTATSFKIDSDRHEQNNGRRTDSCNRNTQKASRVNPSRQILAVLMLTVMLQMILVLQLVLAPVVLGMVQVSVASMVGFVISVMTTSMIVMMMAIIK